jgi:hypothetical protein
LLISLIVSEEISALVLVNEFCCAAYHALIELHNKSTFHEKNAGCEKISAQPSLKHWTSNNYRSGRGACPRSATLHSTLNVLDIERGQATVPDLYFIKLELFQ